MPLYRYECESCGNQFSVLVRQQAQADAPVCPECGCKETRRMVPRVAVQFKGSGYYKTDYARKGKIGSAGAKTSNNSKPGNGTSGSTGSGSQNQDSQNQDSRDRDRRDRDSRDQNSRKSEAQSSEEHKSDTSPTPAKTAPAK